jgi:RNA 3'-terminal phosphate cyclase (ATP)
MKSIDGAIGEGGGQVLRTCLALSIVTGQGFNIHNIRAGRKKPGLRPQHLSAVKLAASISDANVKGAELGSTQISFSPQSAQPGKYKLDIGTAGSSLLVMQTIYLPLSLLERPSSIAISGGTHVPFAPSFDFIDQHWIYFMKRMGFNIHCEMLLAGFNPRGGGIIQVNLGPVDTIKPINMDLRGDLKQIRGVSAISNLDRRIAERQRERVIHRLGSKYPLNDIRIRQMPSKFKGTTIVLFCEFENSQACYFSLGALGKPAEQVADEVCDKIEYFLSTEASIDEYLADQLLLPLSFANGNSTFSTAKVTSHLMTNAEVIRSFIPIDISISGRTGESGLVRITLQKQ